MTRTELAIAGVGGQGSITAGVILGKAAVTHDRKYATQTQAYSSELRGGFAATWVIVSDEPVDYPRVIRPDILIAQAQDSIRRFGGSLKKSGILIMDSDRVTDPAEGIETIYDIAATTLARNQIKMPVTANIIMLGALCRVTDVVSRSALEQAIVQSVPKSKTDLNLKAFQLGYEQIKPHGA